MSLESGRGRSYVKEINKHPILGLGQWWEEGEGT